MRVKQNTLAMLSLDLHSEVEIYLLGRLLFLLFHPNISNTDSAT